MDLNIENNFMKNIAKLYNKISWYLFGGKGGICRY